MAGVRLHQLHKSYDGRTDVLAGIDLEIDDGEFVVLVGPSGCGKSTLLRLLCGLERPSGGTIEIDGERVEHLPPAARGIAMVFQSYALYPHMTVYRNMAFGLKVAGAGRAEIDRRVRQAAGTLKIGHLLDRHPRELSGGQRQRVAIGRAIVREPRLFLFDEPLSNLDAALRVQTRLEIAKLHQQLDATMVYVTHDQVEAMTLGDKIVVMHEGRVQQAGSPLALYQQPANLFVARFIGSPTMNLLGATVEQAGADGVLLCLDGGQRVQALVDGRGVAPGARVQAGLRAEHARAAGDAAVRFRGRVDVVEHLGESNHIHLDLGPAGEAVVRGDGNERVRLGEDYTFSVDPAAWHVFDAEGRALTRLRPGNMVAAQPPRRAQEAA